MLMTRNTGRHGQRVPTWQLVFVAMRAATFHFCLRISAACALFIRYHCNDGRCAVPLNLHFGWLALLLHKEQWIPARRSQRLFSCILRILVQINRCVPDYVQINELSSPFKCLQFSQDHEVSPICAN